MKRIGADLTAKQIDTEYQWCSSDNNSLDGVVGAGARYVCWTVPLRMWLIRVFRSGGPDHKSGRILGCGHAEGEPEKYSEADREHRAMF